MADDQLSTKRCYVCQEYKAQSEFNRSKARKDGLRLDCRACQCAAGREYDHRTRDQRRETKRAWQAANRDKVAGYHKKWASKSREHLAAYNEKYRGDRPGIAKKWAKDHYEANREKIKAANRARWPAVREATRESRRKYMIENRQALNVLRRQYKARKRGAEGTHTYEDILRLFDVQSGRCAYCTTPLPKGYHVDHVQPLSRGGTNWPSNLQLLCPTCNISKKDRDPVEFARSRGFLI